MSMYFSYAVVDLDLRDYDQRPLVGGQFLHPGVLHGYSLELYMYYFLLMLPFLPDGIYMLIHVFLLVFRMCFLM